MRATSEEFERGDIKGWLMLLTAFLLGRVIGALRGFDGVILSLTEVGYPPLFTMAGLLQITMLITAAVAVYYLIKRNPKFRIMVVSNCIASILFSLALVKLAMTLFDISFQLDMLYGLVGTLVFSAIWIPYVYKSRRLKNRIDILDVVAEVMEVPHGRDSNFREEKTL